MAGLSRETQISIAASSMFPGFRFSPTDEELISYYLKKKIEGLEKSVELISEVEIWRHEPWDLPAKSVLPSDNEWYFFTARGRKYPHGLQSKRATRLGYWKATGKERNVKSGSDVIGTKRTLVFHLGRAPKGERTEWLMHEFCMYGQPQDTIVVCRLRKNAEFASNDTSRQDLTSQRPLLIRTHDGLALPEAGVEQSGTLEGANICTSSDNSPHAEPIDSGSESVEKLADEFWLQGSSSQWKDRCDEGTGVLPDIELTSGNQQNQIELDRCDEGTGALPDIELTSSNQQNQIELDRGVEDCLQVDRNIEERFAEGVTDKDRLAKLMEDEFAEMMKDDDCFAEIMKDDIVELDKSVISTTPNLLPMAFKNLESERKSEQPIYSSVSSVLPYQSTFDQTVTAKPKTRDAKPSDASEAGPSCIVTTMLSKMGTRQAISLFLMITILVVLLLSLGGGSWKD